MELLEAVNRPKAWPSLAGAVTGISIALRVFTQWRLHTEVPSLNKGAFLIARSAVQEQRCHSYVATGAPLLVERSVYLSEW